jgi:hypothetical protein
MEAEEPEMVRRFLALPKEKGKKEKTIQGPKEAKETHGGTEDIKNQDRMNLEHWKALPGPAVARRSMMIRESSRGEMSAGYKERKGRTR